MVLEFPCNFAIRDCNLPGHRVKCEGSGGQTVGWRAFFPTFEIKRLSAENPFPIFGCAPAFPKPVVEGIPMFAQELAELGGGLGNDIVFLFEAARCP